MIVHAAALDQIPMAALSVKGAGDALALQSRLTAHGRVDLSKCLAVTHAMTQQ